MSNNLRQIAKDLRSFVKRCKDVHYSDSLLISFLITGLLTIAPKLHADVASEQQEITAQTYDAITDLRQSFMRARKENEKSLKGAQSELVQLLRQGDQVIKSPWSSYQFGTGFTNNDWGTTYRGRGGKFLEYYKRDNDLTKYVFDKDKHLYGATNLNIPRNQEPDALTINPANMHEPYKPYVPERMNNVSMIVGPTFNPDFKAPESVKTYYSPGEVKGIPRSASTSIGDTINYVDASMNNSTTAYANTGESNTLSTGGTFESNGTRVTVHSYYSNWWNHGSYNITGNSIEGGTFEIGNLGNHNPWSVGGWGGYYDSNHNWHYYWGGYWNGSGYSHFYDNPIVNGVSTSSGSDDTNFTSYGYNGYTINFEDANSVRYAATLKRMQNTGEDYTTAWNALGSPHSYNPSGTVPASTPYPSTHGTMYYYNAAETGGTQIGSTTIGANFNSSGTFTGYSAATTDSGMFAAGNYSGHSAQVSVLASGDTTIKKAKFLVYSNGGVGSPSPYKHNGIAVTNGTTTLGDANGIEYGASITPTDIGMGTVGGSNNGNYIFVNAHGNNGVYVSGSGSLNSNNTSFFIDGDGGTSNSVTKSNGIYHAGTGTVDSRRDYFLVSNGDKDYHINGIYNNAGNLNVKGSKFDVKGSNMGANAITNNNGILADAGTIKIENDGSASGDSGKISLFNISGDGNNGIQLKGTSDATIDADFNVGGTGNNGVLANASGAITKIENSSFNVDGGSSNGFYMKDGSATSYVSGTAFGITGTNSNGVFVHDGKTLDKIVSSNFTVGNSAIGLLVGNSNGTTGATVNTISGSTFDVTATNGNNSTTADHRGTGIYLKNGSIGSMTSTTITGNGNDALITIDVNDGSGANNSIVMDGKTATNYGLVRLEATGGNNTAINIQNGIHTNNNGVTLTSKDVSVKGTWNSKLTGSNNTVVRNNYYVNKLTIEDTPTPLPTSISPVDAGMLRVSGDKGIIFSNMGFVKDTTSTVQLDAISMNGKYSAGAAFLSKANGTQIDPLRGDSGVFNGSLKIQGVIGATNNGGIDSSNSVGVYANTGQSSALGGAVLGGPSGSTMTNLKVNGLNIGFNEKANNSILVWSSNGTAIDVTNSYTTNDFDTGGTTPTQVAGLSNNIITDGVRYDSSKATWGYIIDNTKVSNGSVIGYATGYFDGNVLGAHNWASHNDSSKIDFQKEINMVSTEGTALLATNGGEIKSKDVRAGGYKSIIAYADGRIALNNGDRSSTVSIDGNINAADNNTLGYYYDSGSDHLKDTYQNIGAYAVNSGKVTIAGTSVADKQTEDEKQVNGTSNTKLGGAAITTSSLKFNATSLIYGMGAYASNKGNVDITTPIAVISGTNGALYADNNGQITFRGDIINQNNSPQNISLETGGITKIGTTSPTDVRRGRNISGNDHENTTPFYVRRGYYDTAGTWISREGSSLDKSGIVFKKAGNDKVKIDMYDGILLSGNEYNVNNLTNGQYGTLIRDYYEKDTPTDATAYDIAKYRGMENVETKIMGDGSVNLGVINQIEDGQTLV